MTEITITDVAPQTVLGMRRRGFYQEEIPRMLMELFLYVEQEGIQIAGAPLFICHERTPEEAVQAAEEGTADIEVAIPVAAPLTPGEHAPEGAACYTLPGGTMVRAVHTGPYNTVENTYNEIFAWMAEHRTEVAGAIREAYLNDPSEVAEEELLTEILVPVA
jgi:effector-binding domain-containing protein